MPNTPGGHMHDGGTRPAEEPADSHDELREPVPTADKPATATDQAPLAQETSTSHVLATQNYAIRDATQDSDTLVAGLDNDDLWMLIRRFNKQTFHVKAMPRTPPGGLDLNIADEDEFSPVKLRANVERLYMTVIVSLISFGKHVVRLRSWREPGRTAGFAVFYLVAWIFSLVVPATLTTIILLITVPRARDILFPPAPPALVSHKTGGVQTPTAGVLGSHDSVTGAPEKYKGQAVEQEASNLFAGVTSVAIASAAGRHDQGDPQGRGGVQDKKPETDALDPTGLATGLADASSAASGGQPDDTHDKTKQPVEDAVWAKMRPVMHTVGDVADGWERLANALSPTPPFDDNKRLQLAAVFVPILLLSLFVKAEWVVKGTYAVGGLFFFTDPLQQRGIRLLNDKFPGWPEYLEIRNTLLRGVPTNAQLTITLLRIGEADGAPLPPPPTTTEPPPDGPAEIDKHALTDDGSDASHSEIEEATHVDRPSPSEGSTHPDDAAKQKGFGAKTLEFFKGITKAGVETMIPVVSLRAALGYRDAKEKLGILPSKKEMQKRPVEGPVEFKGRYQGKKGAVYVDSSVGPAADGYPASPCVFFSTEHDGKEPVESRELKHIQWSVAVEDIAEIKKVGGLGWKGRIAVGWATDREVKDSILIIDKEGNEYKANALAEREVLFNRLIAMGQQVWESY